MTSPRIAVETPDVAAHIADLVLAAPPLSAPAPCRELPGPAGRTVEFMIDAELAAAIAQRPHRQLDDQGAVYAPPGTFAHVRVRPVRTPARARERASATSSASAVVLYSNM